MANFRNPLSTGVDANALRAAGKPLETRLAGALESIQDAFDAHHKALADLRTQFSKLSATGSSGPSASISDLFVSVSADTPLSAVQQIVEVDTSGGAVTITLPNAAAMVGKRIGIYKATADANGVLLAGTIDGLAGGSLPDLNSTIVVEAVDSTITDWKTVSTATSVTPGTATAPGNVTSFTVVADAESTANQRGLTLHYSPPATIGSFTGVRVAIYVPDQNTKPSYPTLAVTRLDGSRILAGAREAYTFGPFYHWSVLGRIRLLVPEPDDSILPVLCCATVISFSDQVTNAEGTSPSQTFYIGKLTTAKPDSGTAYCGNADTSFQNATTETSTGKSQTHLTVTQTTPSDSRWKGTVFVLKDPAGNEYYRSAPHREASVELIFQTPAASGTYYLWACGWDGSNTNPIVPLITPVLAVTLGTNLGTIDFRKGILDSFSSEFHIDPVTGEFSVLNVKAEKLSQLSAQFQWDSGAGVQKIVNLDVGILKTGALQYGGPGMVSLFKGFDTGGNLISIQGDDRGSSGFVGAWFKGPFGIGGPDPAHPKIYADSSGNVAISGGLISGPVSIATAAVTAGTATSAASATNASYVPGSGVTGSITTGGSAPITTYLSVLDGANALVCWAGRYGVNYGFWGKNVWIGGSSPATAQIYCDAGGNAIFNGTIKAGVGIQAGGSVNAIISVKNASDTQIGWVGYSGGNYGAWFKQVWVGGTGTSDAKIKGAADGSVSITDAPLLMTTYGIVTQLQNVDDGSGVVRSLRSFVGTGADPAHGALETCIYPGSLRVGHYNTTVYASGVSLLDKMLSDGRYYGFIGFRNGSDSIMASKYYIWVDNVGKLRIISPGMPTNPGDGTIIGTQSEW